MGLVKRELTALNDFIPEASSEMVMSYMRKYKIHLKITRERSSILGDYRPAHHSRPHTISVNGNLNKYHFLLTFIHELAHLLCYEANGSRVAPHGTEWKGFYAQLVEQFMLPGMFPSEIGDAIKASIRNPSASTCSDPALFKVFHKYDNKTGVFMVEQFVKGEIFRTPAGDLFEMIEKRRTRYSCRSLQNNKIYLFPGIFEVFKE